ncbi:MAG TPA: preprotein translocase subunit SecG [Longimicrobiales bacterium]
MYGFLLTLLLIVGVFLTVIVLLQAGKGGGLAAMGGGGSSSDTLIGGRQAATLLTKATWVGGGLFLAIALALSVMSSRMAQPSSVLQGQFQPTAPTAPGPLPGIPTDEPTEAPATTPTPEGGTQPDQ